jgi:hypothetical protein
MTLDIDDVVGRLNLALREVAGADIPLLGRYGEAKARAVTQYADLIADAYAAGALDDDELKRELEEIEHMTRRFTRNLKGFAGVASERASRAAVGVLLGAMRAGLSFAGSPIPSGLIRGHEAP